MWRRAIRISRYGNSKRTRAKLRAEHGRNFLDGGLGVTNVRCEVAPDSTGFCGLSTGFAGPAQRESAAREAATVDRMGALNVHHAERTISQTMLLDVIYADARQWKAYGTGFLWDALIWFVTYVQRRQLLRHRTNGVTVVGQRRLRRPPPMARPHARLAGIISPRWRAGWPALNACADERYDAWAPQPHVSPRRRPATCGYGQRTGGLMIVEQISVEMQSRGTISHQRFWNGWTHMGSGRISPHYTRSRTALSRHGRSNKRST